MSNLTFTKTCSLQVPVVQKVDSAIGWINLYPLEDSIGFDSSYPQDSDLSAGQRYPAFEQLRPENDFEQINQHLLLVMVP